MLFLDAAFSNGQDPKDPATWTPTKILNDQKMPEFGDVTEWLNSKSALGVSDLKGKVVVVHFITFG
jgi:hypothetical protein